MIQIEQLSFWVVQFDVGQFVSYFHAFFFISFYDFKLFFFISNNIIIQHLSNGGIFSRLILSLKRFLWTMKRFQERLASFCKNNSIHQQIITFKKSIIMFKLENQKIEHYLIKSYEAFYLYYDYKKGMKFTIHELDPDTIDMFLYELNYRASFDLSILHIEQNYEDQHQKIKVLQPEMQISLYEWIRENRLFTPQKMEQLVNDLLEQLILFEQHGATIPDLACYNIYYNPNQRPQFFLGTFYEIESLINKGQKGVPFIYNLMKPYIPLDIQSKILFDKQINQEDRKSIQIYALKNLFNKINQDEEFPIQDILNKYWLLKEYQFFEEPINPTLIEFFQEPNFENLAKNKTTQVQQIFFNEPNAQIQSHIVSVQSNNSNLQNFKKSDNLRFLNIYFGNFDLNLFQNCQLFELGIIQCNLENNHLRSLINMGREFPLLRLLNLSKNNFFDILQILQSEKKKGFQKLQSIDFSFIEPFDARLLYTVQKEWNIQIISQNEDFKDLQ